MASGEELLKLVEMIHREKEIEPETLFSSIELALETAVRKKYEDAETLDIRISRETGDIAAWKDGVPVNAMDLGRIAAQTAKQVIIQRIREAEQDVVFGEFETRKRELAIGTIQRFERDDIVVSLGRGEGVLPRTERVRGENPRVGDRIRALVLDVKRLGTRVRIILSRTHPDLIRRLFELEVPEIAEGIIEIKHLAREPGYRTKIAVTSYDPKIDCVGACVGVRGSRIRNIIDELNGEKIDIIRWNDSPEVLIMNGLKPAEIESITLNDETGECEVLVAEDQLSLAIGKKGQNVRLAAKLTGWAINIVSAADARVLASSDEESAEGGDSPTEDAGETTVGEIGDAPAIPGAASRTEIIATQVVDAARDQLPISTGETIAEGVPAITDDDSTPPPVAVEDGQADDDPKESPSA
ncbi:MAG: transcription termination/antitermination protein NusA [Planctomycetes bacterium]|nr:transcription termination/antitermination protein NusA [Planctomycetota bacterium]